MLTIQLFKWNGNGDWHAASFIDGKPDAKVIELFGTHILPTAFNRNADAKDVLARIQALNPTAKVVLS